MSCSDNKSSTPPRGLQAPLRNNYFYGKRMDVQHFQMEQDYGKNKQWLMNRLTLGKGVLCGLKVSHDGRKLCVEPGVAIDGLGREILVPVRHCLDVLTQEGACCDLPCCDGAAPGLGSGPTTAPTPVEPSAPTPVTTPVTTHDPNIHDEPAQPAVADGERAQRALSVFTLWLCYRECLTEPQPVLVSDCNARDQCAAGTVVESFCLKLGAGLPELQHDPDWCARLWSPPADPDKEGGDTIGPMTHIGQAPTLAETAGTRGPPAWGGAAAAGLPTAQALRDALHSRRHLLCELFKQGCDSPAGDACVPLAVVVLRDGRIAQVEECLVRPRIYSNAALLDMILCLAERIDACCDGHPAPPPPPPPPPPPVMQVARVEFFDNEGQRVAEVRDPLTTTAVPIDGRSNTIRMRLSLPYAQGAKMPTTHESLNDPDFKRHNVQVVPSDVLNNLPYVPGKLVALDATTLLFELNPESPYSRGVELGWQKGEYRLFLAGVAKPGAGRVPIEDLSAQALDGEPHAPSGGTLSGNNVAGGDFSLLFRIG